MNGSVEVPTVATLNGLVARCSEINRYATQLTAAEETRVAALAAGLVTMRQVLGLERIGTLELPVRHARIAHWSLTGAAVIEAETPVIRQLQGALVLDDHGQVKILSGKTWRGAWQSVSLWRDGVHGLRAADLMDYLARLVGLANERAPDSARELLERRKSVDASVALTGNSPRMSSADVRR
jgi:hypothetical protein